MKTRMIDKFSTKSKGQVVLVVLLASAVVMTLGLSVAKRTVTDTKVDTDEELLKQAFNTAESGVDYYLATGKIGYTAPDGKSVADVNVTNVGGGSTLSSDGLVLTNNAFLFWLIDHNSNGDIGNSGYKGTNVDICVDDTYSKALKIDYYYRAAGKYNVSRFGFNFDSNNGTTVNGFTAKVGKGGCINLATNVGEPLLLAVTPIGGQTKMVVIDKSGSNFPVQGEEITSIGRAGNIVDTNTGVNTQVKVLNRYKVPAFMLDAITAGNSVLSK